MSRYDVCQVCGKPGTMRKHPRCLAKFTRSQQAAEHRADKLIGPKGWTLNLGARGGEIKGIGVFPTLEEAMAAAQRHDQLQWRDPDASYAGYTAQGVHGVWLLSPDTSPRRDGLYERRRPPRPKAPADVLDDEPQQAQVEL